MKKIFKILFSFFLIGVLALIGLHFFLQHGLTNTMRKVVLPRIEEETGIEASIGGLSINLPLGTLNLWDVSIKNPKGFVLDDAAKIDHILVKIDFWTLLTTKQIKIENIKIKDALLNVIRNQAGDINLEMFKKPKDVKPKTNAETIAKKEKLKKDWPEILITALHGNATVKYLDFKLNELDLSIDLKLVGDHISTVKTPNTRWGNLLLTGSAGSHRSRFVTHLYLKLAPVQDPHNISFDLTGKVMEIDKRILDKIYEKLGIKSMPFGINPHLYVRENHFKNSTLNIELTDITFDEHLSKHLEKTASIEKLSMPIPVKGTLRKPKFNIQKAFKNSMNSNSQSLFKAFLQGQLGTEKPPEDITDATVDLLGKEVDEIGDNQALKQLIKNVVNQETSSESNAPPAVTSDALIDALAGEVDKDGKHKESKDALKELITSEDSSLTNKPSKKTTDALIDIISEEVDKDGKHKKYKDDIKAIGNLLFGN